MCVLVDEHVTARREQYAASIDIAPIRVVEDLRTNYTSFLLVTTWPDYGPSSQYRPKTVAVGDPRHVTLSSLQLHVKMLIEKPQTQYIYVFHYKPRISKRVSPEMTIPLDRF